ncbi:MAG: hypothetical protein HN341_19900 [Verrucomicrobia bacterium]|nr:hypothetical protein [Verrucomicrobiota bacterium]
MKREFVRAVGLVVVAACLPLVADGADIRVIWANAGGDREFTNVDNWHTQTNASVHQLPGYAADTGNGDISNAIIQGSGPASLNSPFTPAYDFDVLIVRGSQTLNINADLNITNVPISVGNSGSTDTVNHSNGVVTASALSIYTTNCTYNMSSGTLALVTGNIDSGLMNQSGGDVTVSNLYVGSDAVSNSAQYNLSGGTLTATSVTVRASGELRLTGGSLVKTPLIHNGDNLHIDPGGLLEISGGVHDLYGRIYNYGTVRVIGNAATIDLHQLPSGSGTYAFVLDADGVSTLDYDSWVATTNLTIDVDGSSYTGSDANIILMDAAGGLLNTSTLVNVSGFDDEYIATVVQDMDLDEVRLTIDHITGSVFIVR